MLRYVLFALAAAAQAIIIRGPSGPHPIAHQVVQLVDEARWDPFAPEDDPHKRRILVSVFAPLPTTEQCDLQTVPYFTPATIDTYLAVGESLGLPSSLFRDNDLEVCSSGAASLPDAQDYPIIIHSPGFTGTRLLANAQAQSLASQGYIVVTVDHPYDATVVEFPDGDVVYGFNISDVAPDTVEKAAKVRSDDVSFLIDQLQNVCERFYGSSVSADKVFVYGHSLGGATAALSAFHDERIAGGLNLDGALQGPVADAGLDQPFALVGPPFRVNDTSPPFNGFLDKLRGPKMLLTVEGTVHQTFMDAPLVVAHHDEIPPEDLPGIEAALGSIDGRRLAVIMDDLLGAMARFVFEGGSDATALCGLDDEHSEFSIFEDNLGC